VSHGFGPRWSDGPVHGGGGIHTLPRRTSREVNEYSDLARRACLGLGLSA